MNVRSACLLLAVVSSSARADASHVLDKIEASAASTTPDVALREALDHAKEDCAGRPRDEEACALARELEPMLTEFDRAGPTSDSRQQVLAARRCLSALRWGGREIDKQVRVSQWCAPAFDGCEPGLMAKVGLAARLDRTFIVGNACAAKACPTKAVAASVCEKSGEFYEVKTSRDVTALLHEVWARQLPGPVAAELKAAFAPFFADVPLPKKLDAARLEGAQQALRPKLASRGVQGNFDAFIERLGAPHAVRDRDVSWYALAGKRCTELRYTFEPQQKLELRTPPPSECTGSR